jgi:hypothetical protein
MVNVLRFAPAPEKTGWSVCADTATIHYAPWASADLADSIEQLADIVSTLLKGLRIPWPERSHYGRPPGRP